MNKFLSYALLLGVMGVMSASLAMLWESPHRETFLAGGSIVLIFMSLILERLWPHNFQWQKISRAELLGDVSSFVLVFGLIDGALKWLTPFAILALLPAISELNMVLWQQVVLATLWIEFAAWVSHWGHHRFKPLWALHAMHHSTEQLYTLNNYRVHPLNHILNHLVMIIPPVLIGISADAILVYTVISLPVLVLQHSNIAFDFGRLNLVLNTNDLHRWHHSASASEGTKNLGRTLVIWDQVFKTYLRTYAKSSPSQIGLFQISRNFPDASHLWAQLAWPFSKECCR